jgi:nicotinamidase-related amidase/type 1 glutamine amidotransferase
MKKHCLRTLGKATLLVALVFTIVLPCSRTLAASTDAALQVDLRRRVPLAEAPGQFRVVTQQTQWQPDQTAIIICDMWNQHWCQGATRRVAELAPVMNRVVADARQRGVFIIHAPSETMDHYRNHLGRQMAQNAPGAANVPEGIAQWCHWKDETEKTAGCPIDHSDGGCDCQPPCAAGTPWTKQVEAIKVVDGDAISDSGIEIWNLLQQRGIENVILMGIHTNMCVLGRPFGLRQLSRAGKTVALMRDLTDTMYNSAMAPKVSHFTGTDLVIEHVEKYVCPTITSTVFTAAVPFEFANDARPLVVFVSAESEYSAAETLPSLAHELEMHHGLRCEILQGSTEKKGASRHEISGMEILDDADLVVVFARRRAFPADQMKYLKAYLDRGGPLMGLRTASHAFDARGSGPADHTEWPKFDPEVLGGNYHNHYGGGPKCAVTAAVRAKGHPILAGVQLPLLSDGSLYRVRPLTDTTMPLLLGTIPDHESEPVAWTNQYRQSRIFYTSLGHPNDFADAQFRKLLINAVRWALN